MTATKKIIYPDSDGQPMADNTLQFEWITVLKTNLDWLFHREPDVFVAGDLLWYPVEGAPKIRVAPDVLVARGRPKGYRGSYRQWEEAGTPPTVVIEVLSPGNRPAELIQKYRFYDHHGVAEYYVIDPEPVGEETAAIFVREGDQLESVHPGEQWVSPQLGVRIDLTEGVRFYYPDGNPFLTFPQISERAEAAQQAAAREKVEREAAQQEAAREKAEREAAQQEAAREKAEREAAQQEAAREKADKEAALRELAELRARLKGGESS